MSFNPEIQLGHLLIVASIISSASGAYYALKTRIDNIEKLLERFSERMDSHEVSITTLVGQVQRVVGRMEAETPYRRPSDH